MNYDKCIVDIFITNKNKINNNQIRKLKSGLYPNISDYLFNRYIDSDKEYSEIIWRIYYKIETRTYCKICGNKTPFIKTKYKDYCSSKCAALSKERNDKYKETSLRKYGHINPLHSDKIKEQIKEKLLEKYGVDNVLKSEEIWNNIRETSLVKYGTLYPNQSYIIKEKIKNTYIDKYGCHPMQTDECKTKLLNTCIEKYGEYFITTDKFKEKSKETLIKKYRTDNYRKTNINIINSHSEDAIKKCSETKRKNNTFNKSFVEDECYELLCKRFNNVIRQYRSEKYLFNCDFYISDLDLYIDYNGNWTHGGHTYNKETDKEKLNRWIEKSKHSNFYKNAIYTWTDLDVRKIKCANDNKLNYIIIWNIDELKKWLINYGC